MNRLISRIESYMAAKPLWTNVYGFARTIIAIGTLSSLLANNTSILFRPLALSAESPICTYYNGFSLFCLLNEHLELARFIAIVVLLIVASGWKPQISGIFHWYVSYSFSSSATLLDGGDHITSILTFLLIPLCLTDNRTWHWWPFETKTTNSKLSLISNLISYSSLIMIRFQVSAIYLHAAIGKIGVEEWRNGTAVYYWFSHPTFGADDWLKPIINPIIMNEYTVTFLTWFTILFELLLFAAIIASERPRKVLLTFGIAFHFAIMLIHGLFSFFFPMSAALILYLWPLYQPLRFLRVSQFKFRKNSAI